MAEDEASEKPFEATPRKLEEARKRGEFPISQDLVTFGVYLAILTAAVFIGLWSATSAGASLVPFISSPDIMAVHVFSENGRHGFNVLLSKYVSGISVWFVLPFIFALIIGFLQGAVHFPLKKAEPKLNRISIIKNAKQKYGPDGLFNFAKSAFKLVIYGTVLVYILRAELESIVNMSTLPLSEVLRVTASICFKFLITSTVVIFAISIVDFFWQRSQFLRRQRMSLKELKDELKDTEGDPYTKQARRQMAQDIATNQMLSDVPGADVIVVNPEHFAVALSWERAKGTAPVCVAKGIDEIAARIREIAEENGVPIFRDPPTARALFASVELGEQIPVDHYQAIAAAIRFADEMKEKAQR